MSGMQIEIKQVGNGKKSWERGYDKEARVFIWPEGESVWENLNNRRDRPHTYYRKAIMPQVLAQLGLSPERVQWSQKAGCSCPCSPGFILKGVRLRGDVHVTIKAEECK